MTGAGLIKLADALGKKMKKTKKIEGMDRYKTMSLKKYSKKLKLKKVI